jgi:1-pyrroline-4-hydroxy-2-carboxylate deaminase
MTDLKWEGIYSALLTPFDADDNIDFKLFETNISAQVDAGIDAIVLGGSLGEASTLNKDEKNNLLKQAKAIVENKIPVILNIAEQSTSEGIRAAQNAEKCGADGLMLLPPMRYFADSDETLKYFKSIVVNTSLPVMIYNNPHDYKIEVTLEMFDQMAEFSNIQAIKDSTRNISNVTRLKNRFTDRFKILCGVDTLAYEGLTMGADGWVAGLVDAFPAETVAIYRLIKAGKQKEALKIYRWFFPLLELDTHAKFAQYIKLAATQTRLGSEYVRAPRLKLKGNEREKILDIIKKAISSRHEIIKELDSALFMKAAEL